MNSVRNTTTTTTKMTTNIERVVKNEFQNWNLAATSII